MPARSCAERPNDDAGRGRSGGYMSPTVDQAGGRPDVGRAATTAPAVLSRCLMLLGRRPPLPGGGFRRSWRRDARGGADRRRGQHRVDVVQVDPQVPAGPVPRGWYAEGGQLPRRDQVVELAQAHAELVGGFRAVRPASPDARRGWLVGHLARPFELRFEGWGSRCATFRTAMRSPSSDSAPTRTTWQHTTAWHGETAPALSRHASLSGLRARGGHVTLKSR